MSYLYIELIENLKKGSAEKIENLLSQLEQEKNSDTISEFKKSYNTSKKFFFQTLGRSVLNSTQQEQLFTRITQILTPEPKALNRSPKRSAENDISERPVKKIKLQNDGEADDSSISAHPLSHYGYTEEQLEQLDQYTKSEKIIATLERLHQSSIPLPSQEKLFTLAKEGKLKSLLAYEKHAPNLIALKFAAKDIYRLVKNTGPSKRIELMIEKWNDLKKIKLSNEDILRIFTPTLGCDSVTNILTYLPALREKQCPLSFVNTITNRTQGTILKVIMENYSLLNREQNHWKIVECIVTNTGLNELNFFIADLKTKQARPDKNTNPDTPDTHIINTLFFAKPLAHPTVYEPVSKMSIHNLLN